MRFGYKRMLSDIRQDLIKYVELYPFHDHSNKISSAFKVLLHSPSYYAVVNYRILFWLKKWQETSNSRLILILLNILHVISSKFWMVAMKISITNWPEIGPGLYLSNKGGITMGPKRIGSNCVIHHNVTIGMNKTQDHPDIGNNVQIGSNSVIYGRIIEDGVIVQKETIVGRNVPPYVVIKGNPGRIVCRNTDKCKVYVR